MRQSADEGLDGEEVVGPVRRRVPGGERLGVAGVEEGAAQLGVQAVGDPADPGVLLSGRSRPRWASTAGASSPPRVSRR